MEKQKERNQKREEVKRKKEQLKEHTKILKWILIIIGLFFLLMVGLYFYENSSNHFEYKGLDFIRIREGNLILYNIAFPVYSVDTNEHMADYNFYLRTNPQELEKVPFDGNIVIKPNMVINVMDDFNCNGYGVIAVANLAKLYQELLGVKVIKDPNATCDDQGRYTFVQILSGDQTQIVQTGPSCYDIYVNNCEILPATEKFMAETFLKIK
jgi:hypothetical protein